VVTASAHHAYEGVYVQDVTRFGQFGVDIFFGLSGLLITRLLLQKHSAGGSFSLPSGTFVSGTPSVSDDASFLHVVQLIR